ncbi:hypothetical protein GGR55DRAFT_436775 [Xylaria sp. FL0064]|nr:hypothetical protein GGR55DRAFT_436775 [Xylaria sp. FL0064]
MQTTGMRKWSPRIFYRVDDEDSEARMTERGIWATGQVKVDFRQLAAELERHIEWWSKEASPFVSVYSDKRTAFREAKRRMRNGKKHVTITYINTWEVKYGVVQYRSVRLLAEELGVEILKKAKHNSEYDADSQPLFRQEANTIDRRGLSKYLHRRRY